MKLETYRNKSYSLSKTLSENVRKLAFAGIAIIWIFKTTNSEGNNVLPMELIYPMMLILASLVSDTMQYLFGSLMWDRYCNKKRREGKTCESEVNPSSLIPRVMKIFYILKVLFVIIAYIQITIYLNSQTNFI